MSPGAWRESSKPAEPLQVREGAHWCKPGDDHFAFGIDVRVKQIGGEDWHASMVEVYGNAELRDEIVRRLSVSAPVPPAGGGEDEETRWNKAFVKILEQVEEGYAGEYDSIPCDDGDYTPTEHDMVVARDYAAGVITELQDALCKNGLNGFRRSSSSQATRDELIEEAARSIESMRSQWTDEAKTCTKSGSKAFYDGALRFARLSIEAIRALRADRKPATQEGWLPIESAPNKPHQFFFLLPILIDPRELAHRDFVPSVVQQIDGEFFTPHNEIEPLYFGQNEPEGSPFRTRLLWLPLSALPAPPGSLSRDGGV